LGASQRRKGAEAEREVGTILALSRNARNGLQTGDLFVPDCCPYSYEVKRRARAYGALYAALEQAHGYRPGKVPVAIVRDDRKGWLAVFRLEDALPWLMAWMDVQTDKCDG
jgi:hypothetical protein